MQRRHVQLARCELPWYAAPSCFSHSTCRLHAYLCIIQQATVRAFLCFIWTFLARQAARQYQSYDAFSRVSMAFGTHQLMQSPGAKCKMTRSKVEERNGKGNRNSRIFLLLCFAVDCRIWILGHDGAWSCMWCACKCGRLRTQIFGCLYTNVS